MRSACLLVILAVACDESTAPDSGPLDSAADSGAIDSDASDSGAPDSGETIDSGSIDAAEPDASELADATMTDSGASTTTTLRIHYDVGAGNRITVRGDGAGLSWDAGVDCNWTAGNIWICELEAAAPFEWKPLHNDTTWAKGANWRAQPGATIDVHPHFFASAGRLVEHPAFASATLPPRDVTVYLPASYDENLAATYYLLFMHDGQNLFDPNLAFGGVEWGIDETMNMLVESAGIVNTIVVGVANTSDRIDEYTPTVDTTIGAGGDADLYLTFLEDELRPFIETTYRVAPGRVGIAGSSLGGLVSLYGCWERPTVFDRCGVFSPSLWWDDEFLPGRIAADPSTIADKPLTIYLDSGDSGPSNDGMVATAAMRDLLVSKGWIDGQSLLYLLGEGHAHNETAWAARAPYALAFLLDDPDRVP
jgi:predicted alpha/beta superfamily hydrolase